MNIGGAPPLGLLPFIQQGKRNTKMNKIKLVAMMVCACALLGITGCGNSPDAVALDFMKSIQAGKVDEAYLKANCTEECAKLFGVVLVMGKDEMMKEMKDVKFSVKDAKIDGDKAVVTILQENAKGKEEAKMNLKKVDGKWKIDQKKKEKEEKNEWKKEEKKS